MKCHQNLYNKRSLSPISSSSCVFYIMLMHFFFHANFQNSLSTQMMHLSLQDVKLCPMTLFWDVDQMLLFICHTHFTHEWHGSLQLPIFSTSKQCFLPYQLSESLFCHPNSLGRLPVFFFLCSSYLQYVLQVLNSPSFFIMCNRNFNCLILNKNILFAWSFLKTSSLIPCIVHGIFSILMYNISVASSFFFICEKIVQHSL